MWNMSNTKVRKFYREGKGNVIPVYKGLLNLPIEWLIKKREKYKIKLYELVEADISVYNKHRIIETSGSQRISYYFEKEKNLIRYVKYSIFN